MKLGDDCEAKMQHKGGWIFAYMFLFLVNAEFEDKKQVGYFSKKKKKKKRENYVTSLDS